MFHDYKTNFIPETKPQNNQLRLIIMDCHGSHTAIDFPRICKQNKIHLLFLPSHTSHGLKPLDLGVFAPLKSRYSSEIQKPSSLDGSSPIKKQHFITYYNLVSKETFTPRLLSGSWKAAGIYLFEPSKGLIYSQVQASKSRPSTPPLPQEINPIFAAHTSSRFIDQATKSIRKKIGEK